MSYESIRERPEVCRICFESFIPKGQEEICPDCSAIERDEEENY